MAELKLKSGQIVLVDEEDIGFLKRFNWRVLPNGYVQATVYMHRLLMNTPAGHETDHQDKNTLNNQKQNLANMPIPEHQHRHAWNRKRPELAGRTGKQPVSRFVGVSRKKNRWRATICYCRKRIHLGCFGTEEEAMEAYQTARSKFSTMARI